MKKVIIDKNFFNGFTPIYGCGSESTIMYKNDVLAKIIKKQLLSSDREVITEKLEELDYEGLVTPLYLLEEKHKFSGYVMKYIKDAKSLSDILLSESLDFEQRKQLMLSLSQIFDYFYSQKFAYYDIHGHNFLVKDGNLYIIDLDSGVFNGYQNRDMTYDVAIRVQSKHLSIFTLSFLYNMDKREFINLAKKNRVFLKSIPYELKKYYEFALNNNYGLFEGMTESIDEITQDVYYESKMALKRKI